MRRLSGAFPTLTPTRAQLKCSSTAWRNGNTEWDIETESTSVVITITADRANKVAVFVNGTLHDIITPTIETTQYTITLPAGQKTVTFRDAEGSAPSGTRDQIVSVKPNMWARIPTPTPPQHRLIVIGDSIPAGLGCTTPTTEAWPMLLRTQMRAHNGDLTTFTISGEGTEMQTAGIPFSAVVAEIAETCDGTLTNTIWYELGVNSGMTGATQTPAAIAADKAAHYNQIIAACSGFPGFNFWLQSVGLAYSGYETQSPYTFQDYRDVDETTITALGNSAVHFFHGETLTGLLYDQAHVTTAGHVTDLGIILANSTFAGNIGLI